MKYAELVWLGLLSCAHECTCVPIDADGGLPENPETDRAAALSRFMSNVYTESRIWISAWLYYHRTSGSCPESSVSSIRHIHSECFHKPHPKPNLDLDTSRSEYGVNLTT